MKITHLILGPVIPVGVFALLSFKRVDYISVITTWWWATEAICYSGYYFSNL